MVNVHKLKSATPNLRVVNLYGINFVDDTHVEAFSSNCIQVRDLTMVIISGKGTSGAGCDAVVWLRLGGIG